MGQGHHPDEHHDGLEDLEPVSDPTGGAANPVKPGQAFHKPTLGGGKDHIANPGPGEGSPFQELDLNNPIETPPEKA